jgi:hypothetical protein
MSQNHQCIVCLFPLMHVALDKKSRPYIKCDSCGSIFFARCGDLGIATMLAIASRLDVDVSRQIRAEALADLDRGSIVARLALQAQQQANAAAPAAGSSLEKVA